MTAADRVGLDRRVDRRHARAGVRKTEAGSACVRNAEPGRRRPTRPRNSSASSSRASAARRDRRPCREPGSRSGEHSARGKVAEAARGPHRRRRRRRRARVDIWDEARIRHERFGGLLGVAAGSDEPPRFVVLDYRHGGDSPTLALVGKGVTFDSGGLSLKPSASMEDMKSDMTGAAVVVATMQAAARLAIAGQCHRLPRPHREHDRRQGDEARGRLDDAQRQDRGGHEHRRRGTLDPGRRPELCRRAQTAIASSTWPP